MLRLFNKIKTKSGNHQSQTFIEDCTEGTSSGACIFFGVGVYMVPFISLIY